jgi:hypothetical protein
VACHAWGRFRAPVQAGDPRQDANPDAAGALQGVRKTLHELVSFDTKRVTSLGWVTHPIRRSSTRRT